LAGADLAQPHFAVGAKDAEGAGIFYEPLAAWEPNGNLVPVPAAEIPDIENGGLAADGMSVIWKLKKACNGTTASPSPPMKSCSIGNKPPTRRRRPQRSAATRLSRSKISIHLPCGFASRNRRLLAGRANGLIIPKHLFEPYKGANSREAPANLKPVGTGPYRFVNFEPGDLVKGERNPVYHVPNRPYFDTIELKGGGDAVSAARAVIQTGDFDFAWNTQVED
jgi:peptide/nickel transport system substrate-binding protein